MTFPHTGPWEICLPCVGMSCASPGRNRTLRLSAAAAVLAGSVLAAAGPGVSSLRAVGGCHSAQLRLAATFYGRAGGQFTQTFTFTNISPRVCRMEGWPSLSIEVSSHRPVPIRARRVVQGPLGAKPYASVLLRPHSAASFDVYGADWDSRQNRSCPRTSAVLVTPPGSTAVLPVRVRIPDCPGSFDIAPVIAGRSDGQSWSTVWNR